MKQNHLLRNLKKGLILGLTLTFLCFAAACGTNTNDNSLGSSGDLAGTDQSDRESGVLDQGGADGTDNSSLLDTIVDDVKRGIDDLGGAMP